MSSINSSGEKLRICMVVACANDVSGSSMRDDSRLSPVLHPAIHNLLDGLRERDDIQVDVIYGKQKPESGEDRWDGCLHYVPVSYRSLPIPGMGGPYLARTIALLRYIRQTKPDVVHGQGTERESGLVAALCGRPSVLTLHGNFREIAKVMKSPPWDYYGINARMESFAAKRVSGIICISKYTKDLVADLNKTLWVLPNAVNENFYLVNNTPTSGKVVCLAGITERKNQVAFLQAFKHAITNTHLEVHFWGPINETHPYAQEFLQLIGTTPKAFFHGAISANEVAAVLADADLLVLPSLEDNCPVCILEAMAAGVPVVATSVGGVPDLVLDEKTGLLCPSEKQEEVVFALDRIASDRVLRGNMAIESKKVALDHFSPKAIATTHVKIYRELLA
jgi:glycosyltransferase involved in cell wall biosynthesis